MLTDTELLNQLINHIQYHAERTSIEDDPAFEYCDLVEEMLGDFEDTDAIFEAGYTAGYIRCARALNRLVKEHRPG